MLQQGVRASLNTKNNNNNFKKTKRTMKKIDYQAPEMEVVELKNKVAILAGSETGGGGGECID